MTKTGSTKNSILNLLSRGNKTLSDISSELNLAPSTVSQHLDDLKAMGAIREVQSDSVRKWKYYELNPDFNYSGTPIGEGIVANKVSRRIFYYSIGIILIAAIGYILLSSGSSTSTGTPGYSTILSQPNNGTYVPVRLTDPPIVPNGTSSLVISYSSVALHVNSKAGSGWVESNASGTINLMSLLNVSQVIAGVKVPQNSTIDSARFNISSAQITINGSVYNVTVPSGKITTHVTENGTVNSTSGVLVDLSPTVVAITTNTTTIFVLVPSVKAVVVPNSNVTTNTSVEFKAGTRVKLSDHDVQYLRNVRANLSITGGSISTSNDNTSISITVKNNGNQSILLQNVLLVGNQTPIVIDPYPNPCGYPYGGPGIHPEPMIVCTQTTGVHGVVDVNTQARARYGLYGGASLVGGSSNATIAFNNTMISGQGSGRFSISQGSGASGNGETFIHVYPGKVTGGNVMPIPIHVQGNVTWYGNNVPIDVDVKLPWLNMTMPNLTVNDSENLTLNGSAIYHLLTPFPRGNMIIRPLPIWYPRGIEFTVNSNSTLTLANQEYWQPPIEITSVHSAGQPPVGITSVYRGGAGYTLGPGASATLTFSGSLALPTDLAIALVSGAHYRVEVMGTDGAYAIYNITAA